MLALIKSILPSPLTSAAATERGHGQRPPSGQVQSRRRRYWSALSACFHTHSLVCADQIQLAIPADIRCHD